MMMLERAHKPADLAEERACIECGRPTREDKPYCSRHLAQMPYVARLLRALRRERGGRAA